MGSTKYHRCLTCRQCISDIDAHVEFGCPGPFEPTKRRVTYDGASRDVQKLKPITRRFEGLTRKIVNVSPYDNNTEHKI